MYDEVRHPWINKIVEINAEKSGSWWVERQYTDYQYKVIRVVNKTRGGLAHMVIHAKLPGKKGRPYIERSDLNGETVNAYIDDLTLVTDMVNASVVNLLDKEW